MAGTRLNPKGRVIRIAGLVCGMVLAVLWAGIVFLETDTCRKLLLGFVNQAIPGHVSLEKLDVDMFAGRVLLGGILLEGPDKKRLVRAGELEVHLSWARLLAGEVCLPSVRVNSFGVDLQIQEDGSVDLVSAVVPDNPSSPETPSHPLGFNIIVTELVLEKGTLAFKMPGKDLDLRVSGMDVRVSDVDLLNTSARIGAKFEAGNLTSQGQSFRINPSRIQTDFRDGGFFDILVQADTSALDLSIQGKIEDAFGQPFLDIRLASNIGLEPSAAAAGIKGPFPKGKIKADLSVNGRLDNPNMTAVFSGEKIKFEQELFRDVLIQWKMENRRITVLPSRLSSGLGNLSLEGEVDLAKAFADGFQKPFDLDRISYGGIAAMDGVPFSALVKMEPKTKGRLSSRIRFGGRGIDVEKIKADLTAQVSATGLWLPGMKAPADADLRAEIGLDKKIAHLRHLRLTGPDLVLTGQGQVDIFAMEVVGNLNLEAGDMGVLDGFVPVNARGKLKAAAAVDGPLARPSVSLSAVATNLEINGTSLGEMGLEADLEKDGRVRLDKLSLKKRNSFFQARGSINLWEKNVLAKDPKIQLSVAGNAVFLEDFFPDMTGRISLDGQFNGPLSNPGGVLNVTGRSLTLQKQEIDGFSLKTRLQDRSVEIARLDIQVRPGAVVSAKGQTHPLEETFDMRVTAQDFDLTCVDLLGKRGMDSGRLSVDLTARGRFDDPQVKGHICLKEFVISKEKQKPMAFEVEFAHRRLGIKGNLGPDMEGEYDLDTKAFSLALDAQDLNLSPYFLLLDKPGFTGAVSGQVRAKGQADRLDQVRASARFSKIKVFLENKPFLWSKEADISLENGQWRLLPARIDLLEKSSLTLKGNGDLEGGLDVETRGDIPLEMITSFLGNIESATGLIQVSAFLKGSVSDPLFQGDLLFKQLGMSVNGLEQKFKNMEGRIQFTPDKIEILAFKGYLDQSRFDVGGRVNMRQWRAETFDFKLDAQQLALDIPDLMELRLNCGLTFSGTDQASALAGQIVLLDGKYTKDVELNLVDAATRRTREMTPPGEEKPSDFLKTIGLNIDITRREPLVVDNNLVFLEVSPDLTIQGTAAAPVLAGRAQVDSGRIHFQRVEFDVKKGVIDFVNPYKIDPVIDIEGEMEIRVWTITMGVSGTPDNLDLQFSSIPPEQHGDILSLIAFGKTTRELRAAEGGGRFAPEEIFAGMVADSLQKSLKDATGLEHLEINAEDKEGKGSPGVKVTVGTDLSRQMSVKYGADVRNGETVQRVTTYYKLLEHLLMSGYQDTGGRFGGELKYRLEFR
ncbi:MAG: translocation/assembly module TamB domain-containing protein [Proteobacteria bacterium]|nr:translocation/assembly module TamB domain-containing protein [Pseudomonadota bacterium]